MNTDLQRRIEAIYEENRTHRIYQLIFDYIRYKSEPDSADLILSRDGIIKYPDGRLLPEQVKAAAESIGIMSPDAADATIPEIRLPAKMNAFQRINLETLIERDKEFSAKRANSHTL